MDWRETYGGKRATADEAVGRIRKGKSIFIGSGAAEPIGLVEALVRGANRFSDNPIVHLLTLGPAPYVAEEYAENFRHNAFFIGANVRKAVRAGRADYTPVFLSNIPRLIRSGRMPVDAALIQCSPPDAFGFVNLGVSVDIVLAAIDAAQVVIAEINPNMPVVFGAGFLPMDRIDLWVETDAPLIEVPPPESDEVSEEIGRYVASLIEDRSALQMGIGAIPDATLRALGDKADLGIWTEMFSDGVMNLIENGNITGKYKTIHPNKITSSFTFGSKKLYDFVDRNPRFTFHPSDFVNDPLRIARQPKMVAINSALQVDLTGQVCADSIGSKFYSGIGGQVDFIRGASMSPGGKPIIALPSTAAKGSLSRIVPALDDGAGVVTSRGDVRYVVTEYGVADLQGKSIRERSMALISIAHPDFRSELVDRAKERRFIFIDQWVPQSVYPREYESRIRATDGQEILLRPIRPDDETKLQGLFYDLSENALYQRFMRVIQRIPHKEMQYYLDVDYRANLAIVAETIVDHQSESSIVGVAQYYRHPATNLADVAFVVRDPWQGKGLGSALFDRLIALGKRNGLAGFTADALATNRAMLHVFHKSGLAVKSRLEEGVYRLTLRFPTGEAPKEATDDHE